MNALKPVNHFEALLKEINRNALGFDEMMNFIPQSPVNYPAYNVLNPQQDKYVIEVALAGFTKEDITLTQEKDLLTIEGHASAEDRNYLFKGIAKRRFKLPFALATYIEVKDAYFENGLLKVELERVIPDEMKPTKIEIKG